MNKKEVAGKMKFKHDGKHFELPVYKGKKGKQSLNSTQKHKVDYMGQKSYKREDT